MRLTTSQQEAITATSRNLQILACAGSGKTEVLAHRVAHVLTRQHNPLAPANVVAFTFTNKAAAELRRRIVERVTEQSARPVTGMADMFIRHHTQLLPGSADHRVPGVPEVRIPG